MMQKSVFNVKPIPALGLAALAALLASGVMQGFWGAADLAPRPELGTAWAALAGALGLGLLAWRQRWWQAWCEPDQVLRYSLLGFALLSTLLLLTQRVGVVDGQWYAWAEDDVMVAMQHARHLAEGHGLVWNIGERVQGFSDPLWTLILAGACVVLPLNLAALAPLLLNIALGLICILAVRRLALALGAAPLPAALAAAGLGLSFELAYASFSGLETVAVAALSALALADLAQAHAAGKPAPLRAFVMAGVLGLLRIDGVLPAFVICALAWPAQNARQRLAALALAFGPAVLWMAFSAGYYGDWLPTSVRLKAGRWEGRDLRGFHYLLRVAYHAKWAWACGLLAWALPPLRRWALALAVLLGYALATGGDLYPGTRYLAAAWPLLWALAAAALTLGPRPLRGARAGMVMAAAVVFSYHAAWAFPGLMQAAVGDAKDRIRAARALAAHVKPGEKVAATWAGSFFFFSDALGVDLLGKCDPVIARAPVDPALPSTGHNRLDLAHSLGVLKPAWVLTVPPDLPWQNRWLHTPYDRRVWEDPLFVAHCRQDSLPVAGPWLLCHCHWPS